MCLCVRRGVLTMIFSGRGKSEPWRYCGGQRSGLLSCGIAALSVSQRQDGLSPMCDGDVCAVVDYEEVRVAAVAAADEKVKQVRTDVAKFGQAQRAAETDVSFGFDSVYRYRKKCSAL